MGRFSQPFYPKKKSMSQVFRRFAQALQASPELLPQVLPLIRTAVSLRFSKEFGSKNELERYLKDHPGADKSKHKVVEKDRGVKKEEEGKHRETLKEIGKLSGDAMKEIAKHLAKGKAGFGAPTADQIKHHETATDKKLQSMGYDHSDLEWFKKEQLGPKAKAAITKAVKKLVPSFKERPEGFTDEEFKDYNRKREAIQGALGDYIATQMFAKERATNQYKTEKEKNLDHFKEKARKSKTKKSKE